MKYLPEIKQIWNFVLIVVGALIVFWLVDTPMAKFNQSWQENQHRLNERSEFTEELSVLSFSRIYYAQVYQENVVGDESSEAINSSYNNYIQSVRNWNEKNLLHTIFIEKHFGKEMRNEYENELLPRLTNLHNAVLATRTGFAPEDFDLTLEEAKNKAYVFNEKLYID